MNIERKVPGAEVDASVGTAGGRHSRGSQWPIQRKGIGSLWREEDLMGHGH